MKFFFYSFFKLFSPSTREDGDGRFEGEKTRAGSPAAAPLCPSSPRMPTRRRRCNGGGHPSGWLTEKKANFAVGICRYLPRAKAALGSFEGGERNQKKRDAKPDIPLVISALQGGFKNQNGVFLIYFYLGLGDLGVSAAWSRLGKFHSGCGRVGER